MNDRYGVGCSSTGETEPYTPSCACPCHLADHPYPSSWYCDECWVFLTGVTTAERPRVAYSHDDAVRDGLANPQQQRRHVIDHYFVTNGKTLDRATKRKYKTEERAQVAADALAVKDVVAERGLTDEQLAIAKRFRDLSGPTWYSDDPWWWIRDDYGRYAIRTLYDDGESSWDTVATLDEVREALRDRADEVVDLVTGKPIQYQRDVHINLVSPDETAEPCE